MRNSTQQLVFTQQFACVGCVRHLCSNAFKEKLKLNVFVIRITVLSSVKKKVSYKMEGFLS